MADSNAFQSKYLELLARHPYMRSVVAQDRKIIGLESYTYNVTIGTAARPLTLANLAVSAQLITLSDSDFVFDQMSACVNLVANGDMQFNRNLTLQILDQGTGKLFFSEPTLFGLVAGAGGFPYVFPSPRVVAPNSSLTFTAQNLDTGQNFNQMFVALHGTRVFYAGAR